MPKKIIISGGGTGGHIFPAISIAQKLKEKIPDADFLFIGATGKMEMKRVPEAGFKIEGFNIYGISRDFSLKGIIKNIKLPFVLLKCSQKVKKAIKQFNPDVVIGVGGFASGPALKIANKLKIPTLIQEQNSFPGVTNKLLAKKVNKICVAYKGLEKYFPAEKIVITGNPIRKIILEIKNKEQKNYDFFGLIPEKKTVLVVGGSLGAKSINETIYNNLNSFIDNNIQLIWQTGEFYYSNNKDMLYQKVSSSVKILPFIKEIDKAYSVADIIISRAGAIAISELSIVGKPVILIPFPYAAEDHQTQNALALSKENAAILIADSNVKEQLIPNLLELCSNNVLCEKMSKQILKFAYPNSIDLIVAEINKIINF